MSKKIKKAVILAAGLGTRMLPIAKAVAKEMLPIVDKPAIYYLVEEAVKSGIEEILIITNRDKQAIENYFDYSPEYNLALENKGDEKSLEMLRNIANMADIYYIRQKETRGMGHAVLRARAFVGHDDFAVIYGDDIIIGDVPAISELAQVYNNHGLSVAGVKQVARGDLKKYCSLKVEPTSNPGEFYVYDMNEKPQSDSEIFSDYAILGRVILTPEIFDILENQAPGINGEIQLTDSMKTLARSGSINKPKMTAKVFSGERHDMGSKFGFLRANIIEGLKHPETSEPLREFLKEIVQEI